MFRLLYYSTSFTGGGRSTTATDTLFILFFFYSSPFATGKEGKNPVIGSPCVRAQGLKKPSDNLQLPCRSSLHLEWPVWQMEIPTARDCPMGALGTVTSAQEVT
ncbi:hypothetical protein EVAR_100326_1 [Eumeta japonica]|uniref:Uncharacterized protein n=1 Tax=Eumeta variegata TaxID=151549 RepID=A0A4C1ZRA6_EUMVA|nr:hypothetical protein EVAR_100326_1 [Eumeta japonica]